MSLALLASTHPWPVLAQDVLNCSVSGFCLSGSVNSLLGLPNGTLNIVGYQPWDVIVHAPPAGAPLASQWSTAAAAWGPLEAEARATVAAIHGVPNDFRLPHAAASEVRTQMLFRLIQIAKKKMDSGTLTGSEQDALDAFTALIAARRVHISQKALDEYDRWASDPCHYAVPVKQDGQSFGFEQYDPGSICGSTIGGLFVTPRPPTADQFKAYGAAVALEPFISADREAAWRDFDESLAVAVGVLSAAVVAGAAGVLAVASTAVASTFAAVAGSFSIFGTAASTVAVGSTVFASIAGAATALALPAFIIVAAVVLAVAIIQFTEDQSVRPELLETLNNIAQPDVWRLAQDPITFAELASVLLIPTSPNYTDAERGGAEAAKTGPSQRGAGDPRFEIDGALRDTIFTWNGASHLQETFMSQGWFVTRTRSSSLVWGPWQWSLTLDYRSTLSSLNTRIAGIQPNGFIDLPRNQTTLTAAVRTTQLSILDETFQPKTVKWAGNHLPTVAPTVSERPLVSTPVVFKANASDPDQGDSVAAIRWFIEDPTYGPLATSFDECSFTPPGVIDPLTHTVFQCPWRPLDDNADTGISYTYARPGTWGVRVMAMDTHGGVASQQFTINIGVRSPDVVVTQVPAASIQEGQEISVGGTVNYPSLGDGSWANLTVLVIEWGDGDSTKYMYPCNINSASDPPSDRQCLLVTTLGGAPPTYQKHPLDPTPLPEGPWMFSFRHRYAYRPDRPLPTPTPVKVYAMLENLTGRTESSRFNVTVTDVAPSFEPAPVCPFPANGSVTCPQQADPRTVPVASDVYLRGRIWDVATAQHFVKVLWGDGTSSAYAPGCTTAGCPALTPLWVGPVTPYDPANPPKYVGFTHQYAAVGTYTVKLELDDGGPNGKATYSTAATAFGVSALSGPTDAPAGEPQTYTFRAVTPPASSVSVTPTCTNGSVSNATASSFTCTFDDVAAKTVRTVKLQAVIAGTTFDRTLDVNVATRATTVSQITGPATVTAGTTALYSYTATYSALALVVNQPTCGPYGIIVAGIPGFITCQFKDVASQVTTDVGITVSALGGTASSSVAVTVVPDVTPPVLTLPSTIQISSTSNAGATAIFTASAVDAVSGPAPTTCTAQSGGLFPIGTTTVSCSAKDWKNNTATGSFSVVVKDVTPPSLKLPAPLQVDATGPAGAVATFVASAVDAIPLVPAVTCQPASGSTFAIGTTNVACSATDAAGNKASGTFAITIVGAADQIAALQRWVENLTIDATLQKQLVSALTKAGAAAAAGDTKTACKQLATATSLVNTAGSKLTKGQVNKMLNDMERIRAVIGC
jgi:hypothetical protein